MTVAIDRMLSKSPEVPRAPGTRRSAAALICYCWAIDLELTTALAAVTRVKTVSQRLETEDRAAMMNPSKFYIHASLGSDN